MNVELRIANLFITGVLPITMDDLASGFNVGSYITLDPDFEAMLTRLDDFNLRLPNLNMHNIFVEYFNEIYHIDIAIGV